jgi:hypothetical protein
MNYGLWIDDTKNPKYISHPTPKPDCILVWARDYEQACYYVLTYGLPTHLYLDYNIGCDGDIMLLLAWLAKSFPKPPAYTIISNDRWGASEIKAFMQNWAEKSGKR